jgi:hypothetical protein
VGHSGAHGSGWLMGQIGLAGWLLVVLKLNRIIRKCTDANCSSFHLGVFLELSNPHG